MIRPDLVLQATHEKAIRALLAQPDGHEAAGYLLFGKVHIDADQWSGDARLRLVSHLFYDIPSSDRVSASDRHVTWSTDSFMRLLGRAKKNGMIPAIVHTHPNGPSAFSEQDDNNEKELARTAFIKGAVGLLSLVLTGEGDIIARLWTAPNTYVDVSRILHVGQRIALTALGLKADDGGVLDRQSRLFGEGLNQTIAGLRYGIVGGGGTGSPTLNLLLRLGAREVVLLERDRVEVTNLNRLHGGRRSDAVNRVPKADVHARTVSEADLGMTLVTLDAWAGEPASHDALKACDIIFCCTDDHAGRLFLNRFARFYGIPVIDTGLAMKRREDGSFDLFGRVSTLIDGHACLLCSGKVNARRAHEERLRRNDPDAYERLKEEAYVLGEGDPAPAVVTFTTEVACMAVNTLLHGLTGFNGEQGMLPTVVRRFHAGDDRVQAHTSIEGCPACEDSRTLGRGDVEPFLDMVN